MPITKRLVRSNEATTGRATWETKVALKAIVNAVHPDEVTVKDTFQSAWSQKLGVDESSITIKIGDTVLERGADWNPTASFPGNETKENYDLKIIVTNKVKDAPRERGLRRYHLRHHIRSAVGLVLKLCVGQRAGPEIKVAVHRTRQVRCQPRNEVRGREAGAESKVSWVENFDWPYR